MSTMFLLEFFLWLFEVKKLQSNTISSYECALSKPMQLGFNIERFSELFLDLSESFILQRPPSTALEPQWCLDMVLRLLQFIITILALRTCHLKLCF